MVTFPRRSRGTAEVELILVLPVLLTILLLAGIAVRLGLARVSNVRDAQQAAYLQVTRGIDVSRANAVTPVDVMAFVRPTLPTRFDEGRVFASPKLTEGWLKLEGVTISNRAVFLDPTWHFAHWPYDASSETTVVRDPRELREWFLGYIDEVHTQDIRYGLGLAEPWRP